MGKKRKGDRSHMTVCLLPGNISQVLCEPSGEEDQIIFAYRYKLHMGGVLVVKDVGMVVLTHQLLGVLHFTRTN